MTKKLLPIFLLFFSVFSIAQIQRIEIEGFILVPKNQNPEGVSIFNSTTQKGTTTNYLGQFFITVKENDTLLVSAVQFKKLKTVVTKTMIEDKKIVIELKPYINELGEVIIYKKDFSKGWDLSYQALEYGYDFRPDRLSKIQGNVAEEALGTPNLQNGLNFVSLLGLVAQAIFKNKTQPKIVKTIKLENAVAFLNKEFETSFFTNTLSIPKKSIQDFIFFIGEEQIPENLLIPKNRLLLIDFLQKKAIKYLKSQETPLKKE